MKWQTYIFIKYKKGITIYSSISYFLLGFSGNNKILNKTEKHLVDEWIDHYLKRIQKSVHETAPIPNHMINKREITMNIPGN